MDYHRTTYNFAFMVEVQIPTFYLANLRSQGFSLTFLGPQGPRGASYETVA